MTTINFHFTAFGAPQWHNQRNMANGLNIKEYQRVKQWMGEESPYRYNSTFGYRNGQVMNSSRNEYHKPQMSLNHLWQINHKSSLSTAAICLSVLVRAIVVRG